MILPEVCLRGVHNEIQKLREALPSQVFQVVAKSNQRAKGMAKGTSRPDHKGHIQRPSQNTVVDSSRVKELEDRISYSMHSLHGGADQFLL